jgi:hypothetical protein
MWQTVERIEALSCPAAVDDRIRIRHAAGSRGRYERHGRKNGAEKHRKPQSTGNSYQHCR